MSRRLIGWAVSDRKSTGVSLFAAACKELLHPSRSTLKRLDDVLTPGRPGGALHSHSGSGPSAVPCRQAESLCGPRGTTRVSPVRRKHSQVLTVYADNCFGFSRASRVESVVRLRTAWTTSFRAPAFLVARQTVKLGAPPACSKDHPSQVMASTTGAEIAAGRWPGAEEASIVGGSAGCSSAISANRRLTPGVPRPSQLRKMQQRRLS